MQMLTSKQSLHFSRSTFTNESVHNKKLPLVDPFVLMLLMTVDKSSKFDWICIDQQLNLVFESCAILHGVPPNSSMVFKPSIDIVLFWIWKSPRPCGDDKNPIVLDQYGEQFSIGHRKYVVPFGAFPFLALVIA